MGTVFFGGGGGDTSFTHTNFHASIVQRKSLCAKLLLDNMNRKVRKQTETVLATKALLVFSRFLRLVQTNLCKQLFVMDRNIGLSQQTAFE